MHGRHLRVQRHQAPVAGEPVDPRGADPPADRLAGIDGEDVHPGVLQDPGAPQPRDAGTDDDDIGIHPAHLPDRTSRARQRAPGTPSGVLDNCAAPPPSCRVNRLQLLGTRPELFGSPGLEVSRVRRPRLSDRRGRDSRIDEVASSSGQLSSS
ncbi:hypothetical protein SDC9_166255 [bioreactor metagenome]|uniref:Uncharacterized protein n=1 Tax=bioreactor metagenome TaxID=1076179 RepID=A0A645FZ18_9ZZZZ